MIYTFPIYGHIIELVISPIESAANIKTHVNSSDECTDSIQKNLFVKSELEEVTTEEGISL